MTLVFRSHVFTLPLTSTYIAVRLCSEARAFISSLGGPTLGHGRFKGGPDPRLGCIIL